MAQVSSSPLPLPLVFSRPAHNVHSPQRTIRSSQIRQSQSRSPVQVSRNSPGVICIDTSSPRITSPSSFLKRIGNLPSSRRGSTRSSDGRVGFLREDSTHGHDADVGAAIEVQERGVTVSAGVGNGLQGDAAHLGKVQVTAALREPVTTIPSKRKRTQPAQLDENVDTSVYDIPAELADTNNGSETATVIQPPKKTRARKSAKDTDTTTKARSRKTAKDADATTEITVEVTKPRAKRKPAKKKDCPLVRLRASASLSPRAGSSKIIQSVPDVNDAESQPNVIAPSRRRSWTPVKDNCTTYDSPDKGTMSQAFDHDTTPAAPQLSSMLGHYKFQEPVVVIAPITKSTKSMTAVTKKKQLEVVQGVKAVRKAAPKQSSKPKAPKAVTKRAVKPADRLRNITEHALAPYRPRDSDAQSRDLLKDFVSRANDEDADESDCSDAGMVDHRPAQTGTGVVSLLDSVKPVKTTGPSKVADNLRAQTALQRLKSSDFLFGTSSQLAKEDSPTTMRHLQQAIHDSEETAFASQRSDLEDRHNHSPSTSRLRVVSAPHGTSLSIGPSNGNLWSKSARDADNRTFAVESSRMIDHPVQLDDEAPHITTMSAVIEQHRSRDVVTLSSSPAFDAWVSKETLPEIDKHDSGYFEAEEVALVIDDQMFGSQVTKAVPAKTSDAELSVIEVEPRFTSTRIVLDDMDVNVAMVTPNNQLGNGSIAKAVRADKKSKPVTLGPLTTAASGAPNADTTVLVSLQAQESSRAEVTEPVKKPVRKRVVKAKATVAEGEPVAKKPRGRPSKKALAAEEAAKAKEQPHSQGTPRRRTLILPQDTFGESARPGKYMHVEEILDSEDERALSPRQRLSQSPPKTSIPQPLELSQGPPAVSPPVAIATGDKTTTTASKPKTQPSQADRDRGDFYTSCFPKIARVITEAPIGTITRPSWHEKMLMYDPIVIEDLTDWLNAQGVMVSYTAVVAAKKSKKSKSKAAASTSQFEQLDLVTDPANQNVALSVDMVEQQTETIVKPLEPWMVQRWCESQSICCLWKEGLRGGVRKRY